MTADEAIALVSETTRKCDCIDCQACKALVKEINDLRDKLSSANLTDNMEREV